MLTRLLGVVAPVSLMLACTGCERASVSFSYYDDDPPPVRVTHVHRGPVEHVVVHDCPDCYWNGSKIVVLKGHRHGPGCGHVWEGRRWVIARRPMVVPAHRHHRVTRVRPVP